MTGVGWLSDWGWWRVLAEEDEDDATLLLAEALTVTDEGAVTCGSVSALLALSASLANSIILSLLVDGVVGASSLATAMFSMESTFKSLSSSFSSASFSASSSSSSSSISSSINSNSFVSVSSFKSTASKWAKGWLTSSFMLASGVNETLVCPLIWKRSPVLMLTLSRSLTATSLKVPKPFILTSLSSLSPCSITSKNERTKASAVLRSTPSCCAI